MTVKQDVEADVEVERMGHLCIQMTLYFFFFNDTATTEIYTLSLHDALPIFKKWVVPMFFC